MDGSEQPHERDAKQLPPERTRQVRRARAQLGGIRTARRRPLHALNPARLGYIAGRATLRDAAVLDVGCGAGLLSEALAQAGARVTAIDLAPNLLKVARLHGLERALEEPG